MYRILYNDSTIFDLYGNENEVVTDASMSVEINAAAYMDFTMSRLHPLYNTIAERDGVVTLYWDGNVLFQGVIESIDIDIQGNKAVSCVSALDYLNDTVVRPYSTIAGEQELTAPSSVDGYFQWLIDQHNERVLDSGKRFDVGVNQGANLQQNNFIYRSSTNNPTTASEISDQLLDALGGYLTMRYVDDRYVLDLYADLHTMNAQIVDFGVNITDFSKTIDTKDQYTALILKGGSPEFQGGDFESGDWSHWVTHPNEPLVGDKTHGGDVSSYFVSGAGEYVNDSFFYFRSGRRYKATVYVKNERGSNVTIRGSYQYEQSGTWTTVNVGTSLTVENKGDQWTEFSFDFQPNLSEYTKIRPRWYFDNVTNDGNRRVYLDDFSFSQVSGDTDVAEDPISVSMVPDGGTQYDSNILKTGDVIYDPSSVSRYGYKEEVHEDSTITDVDDLLQAGIKELNKLKDPQIGLDIKAVDLAMFMEGYTHLNVGDAVRVRSAIHDTDEFLMVNSITLDLQDPGQSEYNIGKAYDSLTGQQSGFLRSLNSGINSSLDAVASLDQTTKDQAIQIGNVEQVANDASEKADNAQNTANSNKEEIGSIKDTQTEYEKQLEQMQQGVADATEEIGQVNERIEGMNSEIESAKSDIDSLRSSTETELQNVKDSVSGVRSDVDAVTQKAEDLASDLDGTKATVEQVTTDLGEVKTTVSNAATKADQSLQVSTQASQTATQAKTTATSAYQDAQSALTQSSTASQTANAVKTELETKYSTTDEIAEQYATKSLVEQTSQSITSTVEAKKLDGAVTTISQVSQRVDSVSSTITQVSGRVDDVEDKATSALTKSSELEQTLDGFKTSVQQTYETKNDALSKQSSLQQSVNNLRTEVSETYTTKTEFGNLQIGGTNLIRNSNFSDGRSDWSDWGSPSTREIVTINSKTWAHIVTSKQVFQGYQQKTLASQTIHGGEPYTFSCLAYAGDSSSSKFTVGIHINLSDGHIFDQFWHTDDTLGSDPKRIVHTFAIPENCEQFNVMVGYSGTDSVQNIYFTDIKLEVGAKPTDWSPAPEDLLSTADAAQTYSTKSYVDQTSRTVSLGVVEEYKNGQHGSALATRSDITAAKDSITSTVSQTYLSKNDASVQYATKTQVQQTSDSLTVKIGNILNNPTSDNLWPNQWFDDDKPLLGSPGTENPPSGGKSRLLASRDHFNGLVMAPVYPGHRYRITADAKRTAGSVSLKAGIWYTKHTSENAFDSYTNSTSSSSLGNDWNRYTWEVTVPSGKQAGSLYFQLEQNGSGGSTKWLVGNAILQDITAAYNAQSTANTANSNAHNAQSTANTANSNAINANNRVGNLETCIKMTSDGVRVGKISNGNFAGYSALVNSSGSFDILDSSTKTLASFNKDGLRINSSSNRGMLIGFNPNANSGYIGSTPMKNPIGGEHIDIGMNMDFSSGGGLNIIDELGEVGITGNGINLMTTGHGRVGINFMDVRGAGVVLFDKDDGHYYASVEIAIGHNFGEFNYIMCFFRTNDGQYFGGTAYHPDGKEYNFMTMGGGAGSTDMPYLKGTRWAFNGRMATRRTTFEIGPGYSGRVDDSVLRIVAIVGFDYYKTSG